MIYVSKQTTQTATQYVADASNPGKDVLYTPPVARAPASPSPSAAAAADKDCS